MLFFFSFFFFFFFFRTLVGIVFFQDRNEL